MDVYIGIEDLQRALSPNTVGAIFDDYGDGAPNAAAVEAVIDRAEGMVDSFLVTEYTLPLPSRIDRLVKHAALEFAVAFSFERHPEYVRTFGEDQRAARWERGIALMERIANAVQMLPDAVTSRKPANTGGIVYDNAPRILIDGPDGTSNAGDF